MVIKASDLYTYRAHVVKVYDGDTITVDVDLGFGIKFEQMTLRFARINTPEIRGIERPEGLKSKSFVKNLVLNKDILIKTYKDQTGKYGRYITEIIVDGVNLNDLLVSEGLAVYRNY